MTHGHWGKFASALEDAKSAAIASGNSEVRLAAETLSVAQRFYLPQAKNVLVNMQPEIQDLIRLPYPAIAVLSEENIEGEDGWKISLAFSASGLSNCPISNSLFALMSLFRTNKVSSWRCLPAVCLVGEWDYRKGGFPTFLGGSRQYTQAIQDSKLHEFQSDISSVTNLLALLGVSNVTRHRMGIPERLSSSRMRRGKSELLDYHVLVVDGERWEKSSLGSVDESEHAYRSHLRRGHIRRLADGRRVWVRASYVRGGIPGFVAKDYEVRK